VIAAHTASAASQDSFRSNHSSLMEVQSGPAARDRSGAAIEVGLPGARQQPQQNLIDIPLGFAMQLFQY